MPMYFRNSRFVVIVYSITERATFDGIQPWIEIVNSNCTDPAPLTYLVGNKTDLEPLRTVSADEGRSRADQIHATFFELSAKSGENILELFQHIASTVISQAPPPKADSVEIDDAGERKAGGGGTGCC
jgi:GTPase SAR1 family protein